MNLDLRPENLQAWELWGLYAGEIVALQTHMAGVTYTLNSAFLVTLMEWTGINDPLQTFRKIRAIFNEWKRIQDSQSQSQTHKSMARTKALRGKSGGS